MAKLFHWVRDVVADLTSAAPPRRANPENRDWMPTAIARSDLASPYFLAMADRDAGWYEERIGAHGWGGSR